MWFPCSYTFSVSAEGRCSINAYFFESWTYLLRYLNRELTAEKFTLVWITPEKLVEHNAIAVSQADCREITRSRNAAWLTLLAQCVSIWDLHVPSNRIPCASLERLISWFWATELSGQLAAVFCWNAGCTTVCQQTGLLFCIWWIPAYMCALQSNFKLALFSRSWSKARWCLDESSK